MSWITGVSALATRIILRYLLGALLGIGLLETIDVDLLMENPALTATIAGGVAAALEALTHWVRRKGGVT